MKDKRRAAARWFVLLVPFIVVGTTYVALSVWEKMQLQKACDDTVDELPLVIPQRLIVNITDEWGRRLEGDSRFQVESSLRDALSVYTFSDRIVPRFENDGVASEQGDHAMGLAVELGHELGMGNRPWKLEYVLGIGGRMCSNMVLVAYTDSPQVLRLRFIHELGHFLGLPHEAGTYMRDVQLIPDPAVDLFNSRQLEILDAWNHPGTGYTPHWLR